MQPKTFSIREAISYGWNLTKKNLGFFILLNLLMIATSSGASLVATLITVPFSMADKNLGMLVSFIARIAVWAVNLIISIGEAKIFLKLYDNEKPEYSDLFKHYRYFWRYFWASILYGLAVFGAVISLALVFAVLGGVVSMLGNLQIIAIIVGILVAITGIVLLIYLGVKLQFYSYLIVDKNYGPLASLKKSSQITKGVVGKLILLSLAIIGINILGFLALVVGLFLTVPTGMAAVVYVYRKLLSQTEGEKAAATEVAAPPQQEQPVAPASTV